MVSCQSSRRALSAATRSPGGTSRKPSGTSARRARSRTSGTSARRARSRSSSSARWRCSSLRRRMYSGTCPGAHRLLAARDAAVPAELGRVDTAVDGFLLSSHVCTIAARSRTCGQLRQSGQHNRPERIGTGTQSIDCAWWHKRVYRIAYRMVCAYLHAKHKPKFKLPC